MKKVVKNKVKKIKSNEITKYDVLRALYGAGEPLKNAIKKLNLRVDVDILKKEEMNKAIKKVKKQVDLYTKKELDALWIDGSNKKDDHPRRDRYNNCVWSLEKISLHNCGVWPRMGSLPTFMTLGSAVETAGEVKKYIDNKTLLSYETKDVLAIERLQDYTESITKAFPIIVVTGGLIRKNKNKKSSTHTYEFKKCLFDIDDGNHRAVALALLGKTETMALVGRKRKTDNTVK